MPVARETVGLRAATLGGSVAVPWIVYLVDLFVPGSGSFIGHGIVPRTWSGLEGIPTAPFIHIDLAHLLANTGPLIVLGALVLLRGVGAFLFVALTSAIVGGIGTWLLGAPGTHHVGASGIVFGFFGYLLLRAAFDRRWSSALIAVIVAAAYGMAILYSLIPQAAVSWSGHFFGFIGGAVAARLRYPRPIDR